MKIPYAQKPHSAKKYKGANSDLPLCEPPHLYGSPTIQPDEAPSSWTYRVAAVHRCSPSAIARLWNWELPTAQLDFTSSPPDIGRMAESTFTAPEAITHAFNGLTLLSDSQYACLTQRGSFPIYRYCVSCLAADEIAHFRTTWRLAFSFVCQKHHELLRDSCPYCGRGLDLSKHPKFIVAESERVLAHCPQCSGRLDGQAPISVPESWSCQICAFQCRMYETIRLGYFKHPRLGTISAKNWLQNYLYPDGAAEPETKYKAINLKAALLHLADPLVCLWEENNLSHV